MSAASPAAPAGSRLPSCPRTRARWARARRRWRPTASSRASCTATRTAAARALRQAIGRRHNLDPERDRLRRRLGRADRAPGPRLCRAGRRGALQPPRLSDVPAGRAGGRRAPGGGARARPHAPTSTRCWRTSPRAPGWCSWPTPTTRPAAISPARELRRLRAGLPDGRDPGDRRRLRRVCRRPPTTTAAWSSPRRRRQHRDAAHLLQALRPGRAAAGLADRGARDRRRDEPGARPVQRLAAGPGRRRRGARRTRSTPRRARAHNRPGCPGSARELATLGPARPSEPRQLRPGRVSRRRRPRRRCRQRLSRGRGHHPAPDGRLRPAALPAHQHRARGGEPAPGRGARRTSSPGGRTA